jgi:hypothetical protein
MPPGGNINDAIAIHPAGVTIIVPGGVYEPIVVTPGTVFGPIFIEAGDEEQGNATIVGVGENAAITLDGQTNFVIDAEIVGGGRPRLRRRQRRGRDPQLRHSSWPQRCRFRARQRWFALRFARL